jgi:phage terminase large subunit GpA-like protein
VISEFLQSSALARAECIISDACRIMAPPPKLTVSQWADAKRMLGSNSAEPGQWHTNRAPYLREIMDAFSDPRVTEVTFKKSAQVGGTECMNNVIGYFMDQDPSTIMYACETTEKAEAWSKERFMNMIASTPCLRDKIQSGLGPISANTIPYKEYPGGYICIVGAGSDGALASRPVRVLIKDELDKWVITKAGDPGPRADMRTITYLGRKKIGNVSTPLEHHPPEATSRITEKYEASDKRKFHVRCPFCRHEQILREAQLKFTRPGNSGDIVDDVWYECEHPACPIKKIRHTHKHRMLATGRWIAEKSFNGHAGFWINALYSPWVHWQQYAEAKLRMTRQRDTHKTFHNEWRGEAWDPVMETDRDLSPYLARREYYEKVPLGAMPFLFSYADVQKDRIEAHVIAVGPSRETWGLDHRIFWGEPAKLTTGYLPPVWQELEAFRQKTWEHESGEVCHISRMFIDMSYLTAEVLKFCKGKRPLVWPARGMSDVNTRHPFISTRPAIDQKGRYKYFQIGPNEGKDIIFSNLAVEPPKEPGQSTPGYMHFNQAYDEEFFKQLLASEVGKWQKGIYVYRKITENVANEGLDLCVGALAAFESTGTDPKPYVEALRKQWEKNQGKGNRGQDGEIAQSIVPQKRGLGLRVISKGVRR